jgi:helix-turn-helix protein
MSAGNASSANTKFRTRFYATAIRRSDIQNGVCKLTDDRLSLRAGTQSVAISFDAVRNLSIGAAPDRVADAFDQVVGIKFRPADTTEICFIEYDPAYADVFAYQLFAKLINGATGVVEFGAQKGGQQTDTATTRVEVAIDPNRVVFNPTTTSSKAIALGEIVNIQFGKRTVGGTKRDVIKVDHMDAQTRTTSYLSLDERRLQRLFNRYLRTEYAQLRAEIEDTAVSEAETQLVIGYYTTHNLTQTMHALTDGNTSKFESLYQQALDHGLVTHPDDGVGLTQKGKMLANTELHTVNT